MDRLLIGLERIRDYAPVQPNFLQTQKIELERSIMYAQRNRLRHTLGMKLYLRLLSQNYTPELQLFFDNYVVPTLATATYCEILKNAGFVLTPSGLFSRSSDEKAQRLNDLERTKIVNEAEFQFSDYNSELCAKVVSDKFTYDGVSYEPRHYTPYGTTGLSTKIKALNPNPTYINTHQDRLP